MAAAAEELGREVNDLWRRKANGEKVDIPCVVLLDWGAAVSKLERIVRKCRARLPARKQVTSE